MRGLAKASSAGSTSSQGHGLGSLIRGAFALRGLSSKAKGSGALSQRLESIALPGLIIAVVMALTAGSATAAETHPYTGTSFGPDGVGGSAGFANLQSLAVDQASGNVFAYDAGEGGKVYKFDSAGVPVNFSSLPGNAIEGVGGGGGNGEYQIAIAPAGSSGGTAGDIYVANNDTQTNLLRIFSAAGASLGSIAIGGETCGVAVNPAGHVFVGVYPSEVREFVPTANPPTVADESATKSSGVVSSICNVAADGLGNVYAAGYSGGPVSKLEGLGDASADVVDASASTMAIDPTTNDLYTNRRSEFAQYSSAGNLIGTSGNDQLSGSRGIAIHGASEKVYVANSGTKIDVFGPSLVVPGVSGGAATAITGSKATLNGTVNPAGLAVTDCKFEYGIDQSYGQSKPCGGAIPTDEADHAISAALTGLAANTTYHFRIAATNANGTVRTIDQSFSTSLPALTGAATAITSSKAILNGKVLPEGETITECFFEYGTDQSFGSTVPCAESIPTDEGEHPVTAQVEHLAPNRTFYFFRLVINRAAGIASGQSNAFFTEPSVVTGSATAINPPNATLNGTVSPGSGLFTDCTFEYGPTTAYGQNAPCAESAVEIGEEKDAVPVHTNISGLTLGATYHYRLIATNAQGTVRGGDERFTTPGAVIESQSAASVDATEATLKAKVNPAGTFTTYHLEYGTDSSYGTNTPERAVGSDTVGHTLTELLTGLTAGTTYHYRFLATNSIGTTEGPDRSFSTSKVPTLEASCSNQAYRIGASANLPDCRAYEMVSPVDKNNGDILPLIDITGFTTSLNQSSVNGEKITYTSYRSFGDAKSGPYANQYLASRDGHLGWLSEGISPPQTSVGKSPEIFNLGRSYNAFSPDLSLGWLEYGREKALVPGAPAGLNFYRRDNQSGSYEALIDVETNPLTNFGAYFSQEFEFQGVSSDGSKEIFKSSGKLTPDASNAPQLYQRSDGGLHLVCVLPNGTPSEEACSAGTAFTVFPNIDSDRSGAMSSDGSAVYWSDGANYGPGKLYLRENPDQEQSGLTGGNCLEPAKACTVEVSGLISSQPARFWDASVNGGKALFSIEAGFFSTGDKLYEFDRESGTASLIADGMRGVLGMSDDGSIFYFVSTKTLAPGAVPDGQNLYVSNEGALALVATLSDQDARTKFDPGGGEAASNIEVTPSYRVSRVSPDGRHIAFVSNRSLTGYDNTDANTGQSDSEVYTYEVDSEGPVCISCNPTGARPKGRFTMLGQNRTGGSIWTAASLPGWASPLYATRSLTDDGSRIFFNSYDGLVPRDTNGKEDVYEWEAVGAGSCSEASPSFYPSNGGCISLISTGESLADSELVDISPDGSDVFFVTLAGLLPQDPGLIDIYDARAGGGFPLAPALPASCEGEACQGPLSPPSDPTPTSATFQGAGNVKEGGSSRCAKGKSRRKGRCVAKGKHKPAKKRANKNRRTAR